MANNYPESISEEVVGDNNNCFVHGRINMRDLADSKGGVVARVAVCKGRVEGKGGWFFCRHPNNNSVDFSHCEAAEGHPLAASVDGD